MTTYIAYGLDVDSDIPLPGLLPTSVSRVCQPDVPESPDKCVQIRLGCVTVPERPQDPRWRGHSCVAVAPDDAYLHWDAVGSIHVQEGSRLTVQPAVGVEPGLLHLHILGPAFALLLHQRGDLVLHASCIAAGGRGAAFLGGSYAGKSTMAAAMYARGCTVVADDVTTVATHEDGLLAYPSLPLLKLWPEALRALGEDPDTLPVLHSRVEKRSRTVIQAFASCPISVQTAYVLVDGDALRIETLTPREACTELIRHSYCARLIQLTDPDAHLKRCARFLQFATVRKLERPRDLRLLSAVAQAVEDDLARITSEPCLQ